MAPSRSNGAQPLPTPIPAPPFIKGVTYFGRAWPINFWNSDLSVAGSDFRRMQEDGFNAVVMVVPWAEFQPHLEPVTYNEGAFTKLKQICEQAKSADLRVFFRVSYLWDFGPDEQMPAIERANSLVTNDSLQPAWQAYLRKIHTATRDCADGYFLSWEDYWHVLDVAKAAHTDEDAVKISRQIGFDAWARVNASQPFRDHLSDDFKRLGAYPLPPATSPDFREVYRWFDDQVSHRLLARAASVLPRISIEARVDSDPVYRDGKVVDWFSHVATYDVKSSPYLMTYWSPAMGAQNRGEKDTAETAIGRFVYMQKAILQKTQNRLFIEQFLYTDNTPKMSHNAVIDPGQMNEFLLNMPGPLLQFTSGYALWGYQNYRASSLYNGSFALDLAGWVASGQVALDKSGGAASARIADGASIKQRIPASRDHYRSVSDDMTVSIAASGEGVLEVKLGDARASVRVSGAPREYTAVLKHALADEDFEIAARGGALSVTGLYLYRFVQASSARDDRGAPLPDLEGIREMNRRIDALDGLARGYSAQAGNIDRVVGVYSVERDGDRQFAWAGPKVNVYIRAASDSVTVKGKISTTMFHDSPSCRISGYVNDVDVGSVEFNRDGPFVMRLPVLSERGKAPTKVGLTSSCETRPIEGKGDQRVLSFVLDSIES